MIKRASLLVWLLIAALVPTVQAQEKGTFVVQDGAFPWYDRVNNWALANVPESLKGNGPLPQQSCSSRGLELPDTPKTVTIGVSVTDLEKFKQKFPATIETGESIAVKNAGGDNLPYVVVTLSDPPAKIEGNGVFNAGLLLLKLNGTATANTPAPVQPATPPPIAPPPDAGDRTFMVQEGAFPWYDRINNWALTNVPDDLKGAGPLPQQSCSSRGLVVPGTPKTITIGVAKTDLEKFKQLFPATTETGASIAVKNAGGQIIPYAVVVLIDPPAKIENGGFDAGLLLLKLDGAKAEPKVKPASVVPKAQPRAAPLATVAVPGVADAASTLKISPAEKANFHLYLLMGQSNMVGRDTSRIDSQQIHPRVLCLDSSVRWLVAKEPMHAGGSGIGPGISFAVEMLKANPNATIGLIPTAVGGTPLSRWVKGGDLYEQAVSRAKIAMEYGTLKGVLWHQGESDTNNKENAASYETRLSGMFSALRQDLNAPNLPIVVGQLGEFLTPNGYPFVVQVRTAIAHIPADVPNAGFADSKGLGNKGDNLHFSADAQEEFGRRFAASMIALQTPKSEVKKTAAKPAQK